jgi:hypothetical protein
MASLRLWAILASVTLSGRMMTTSLTLLDRLRQPNQDTANACDGRFDLNGWHNVAFSESSLAFYLNSGTTLSNWFGKSKEGVFCERETGSLGNDDLRRLGTIWGSLEKP